MRVVTSEMVERVARAIFCSRYPPEVQGDRPAEDFWPERIDELVSGPPFDADGYRDMARAAIEAMREPTEAMCDAADWQQQSEVNAYQRAIDAALEGK